MGRRSRQKGLAPPRQPASASPRSPRSPRSSGRQSNLTDQQRILVASILAGAAVAIGVLLGIATLGGTLGPWLVAVAAALCSMGIHGWTQKRLAQAGELAPHDRSMALLATGLLVMATTFALLAAIIVTVAG